MEYKERARVPLETHPPERSTIAKGFESFLDVLDDHRMLHSDYLSERDMVSRSG